MIRNQLTQDLHQRFVQSLHLPIPFGMVRCCRRFRWVNQIAQSSEDSSIHISYLIRMSTLETAEQAYVLIHHFLRQRNS